MEEYWKKKTGLLTHFLMISGALNIGFLATFFYSAWIKEKPLLQENFSVEKPLDIKNGDVLNEYCSLSFTELLTHLNDLTLLEEGYSRRDLALACLVGFHYFDLKKALKYPCLQERTLKFKSFDGTEEMLLSLFPGLEEEAFSAVIDYIQREKWPFTPEGLFSKLKKSQKESTLLDAFLQTEDFHFVFSELHRLYPQLTQTDLLALVLEIEWSHFVSFPKNPALAREWLIKCLKFHSRKAAFFLIEKEHEYTLKKLDDPTLLLVLKNLEGSEESKKFVRAVLKSKRSDGVYQAAAELLYAWSGETCPSPYQHLSTLTRFFPEEIKKKNPSSKIIHTIQDGENLWKIARKYKVSLEKIKTHNNMTSDKLKPGKTLEIPQE